MHLGEGSGVIQSPSFGFFNWVFTPLIGLVRVPLRTIFIFLTSEPDACGVGTGSFTVLPLLGECLFQRGSCMFTCMRGRQKYPSHCADPQPSRSTLHERSTPQLVIFSASQVPETVLHSQRILKKILQRQCKMFRPHHYHVRSEHD